jgi:protein-tyrosine phosphatase
MIPLVDMHCHLLAGLDDGPSTDEDALTMCQLAYDDGIRLSAALAHQNERWAAVKPDLIRERVRQLADQLRAADIPLAVFPCAEVMVQPATVDAWRRGELLSVADRKTYLLVELPHGLAVDLTEVITGLGESGARPILAHPERHPEFLHEPDRIERLIDAGCLVQVSSGSVTDPPDRREARALRDWFRRGVVHLLGSDGHSPRRRRPHLAAAYLQICDWAGEDTADRVCSTNGTAVVHGLPLRLPPPQARRAWSLFGPW